MTEVVATSKAPLDELMLAMDVVDTLRHRELMLARELEADDRDQRLLERLREIYAAQGIDVTDEVLAEGVRALREERFAYAGAEPSFSRTLAMLYVTRERWGKWAGGAAVLVVGGLLAFQLFVRGPELRAYDALPAELAAVYEAIDASTDDTAVLAEARALVSAGDAAIAARDLDDARVALGDLRDLDARLARTYEIRVVSRPGELSGVWRVPDENPNAQNFYLIVEAIDADGDALSLPITSEETGETSRVSRWGLRVDEATFRRVAADKGDDGIIQQNVVGTKARGALEPDYRVASTGAAITSW